MKKVLHVSHSLDTGGGPLYIKKIIQDIPQIDHYVVGNDGYFYSMFKRNLGEQKVGLLRGKNLLSNIKVIEKMCRENSISVIHCHGRGAALYTRLLKLFKPYLHVIYTVHGFHPDTLSKAMQPIYILTEKFLYHLTDVVINVSLSEHERFKKKISPNDSTKIHYIPNYISRDDHTQRQLSVTLEGGCINFVYVGRLSHEKGIDILVEAWKKMMDERCRLYIMGYGPLEPLVIASSKEDKRIVYLGKVENASSFLHNFDTVVIPSRFEGMPYIGLESMISKSCVIVTPAVGIIDLFTPNTSYMAGDFSPEALFRVMDSFRFDFLTDRKKIATLIELNYERVQRDFSKKNVSKIHMIYESYFS